MILFFFLAVFIFVGFFGFFVCSEMFFSFGTGDDVVGEEETRPGEGLGSGSEVGTGLSEGSAFTLSELFSTSDTANNVLLSLE